MILWSRAFAANSSTKPQQPLTPQHFQSRSFERLPASSSAIPQADDDCRCMGAKHPHPCFVMPWTSHVSPGTGWSSRIPVVMRQSLLSVSRVYLSPAPAPARNAARCQCSFGPCCLTSILYLRLLNPRQARDCEPPFGVPNPSGEQVCIMDACIDGASILIYCLGCVCRFLRLKPCDLPPVEAKFLRLGPVDIMCYAARSRALSHLSPCVT